MVKFRYMQQENAEVAFVSPVDIKEQNSSAKYHDSFWMDLSYTFVKLTLGTLVRLIWVKKIEGLENIPKTGPVIVVLTSFYESAYC